MKRDFAKLDTEVYECMVPRGARETLQSFGPTFSRLFAFSWREEEAFMNFWGFPTETGYQFFGRVDGMPMSSGATITSVIAPDDGEINVPCQAA
jgi:hypothetical protein